MESLYLDARSRYRYIIEKILVSMAFLSMNKFFILHFLHEKIKNSVLDFVNIIVYPDAKCLSYIFHII